VRDYTPEQLRRLNWLVAVRIFGDNRHLHDGDIADIRGPHGSLPAEAYTTDWQHVGRVLEWLVKNVDCVCIDTGTEAWGVESDNVDVSASSLSLAVCLHALAVVGVDVETEINNT
jgi:hypothetical protein